MSLKYRLYPTEEQAPTMLIHCDHARFIWNLALSQVKITYKLGQKSGKPRWVDQHVWYKQLTEVRQTTPWLTEGSHMVQQQALRDLQQAFKNRWKRPDHFGHPKWRTKTRGGQGFRIVNLEVRKLNGGWAEVRVPKVGWVKFKLSRPLDEHKSARITIDRSGRWHVSLTSPQPEFSRVETKKTVGIDRGITDTIFTSGNEASSPKGLSKEEAARKKRLQRRMAKQVKGSNRRKRTKKAIAKLSAREADRRKDWVEKTSTNLVKEYDVIVFEDLKVKNMMRSAKGTKAKPGRNVAQKRGLNREIGKQGWSMLKTRVEQKAETCGVEVIEVDPRFTSQDCSSCSERGSRNKKHFSCEKCGLKIDADYNAALNIKAAGLAVSGRGGSGALMSTYEASTLKKELV